MEELTHTEIKVRMFNKSLFGVPNRGDRVRKIFKLLKNFSDVINVIYSHTFDYF